MGTPKFLIFCPLPFEISVPLEIRSICFRHFKHKCPSQTSRHNDFQISSHYATGGGVGSLVRGTGIGKEIRADLSLTGQQFSPKMGLSAPSFLPSSSLFLPIHVMD